MPFKVGGEIPKGHVKLPEPLSSDYLIPTYARASSSTTVKQVLDDCTTSSGWSASGIISVSSSGYIYTTADIAAGGTSTLYFQKDFSIEDNSSGEVSIYFYGGLYVTPTQLNIYADSTLITSIDNPQLSNDALTTMQFDSIPAGTRTLKFELIVSNTDSSSSRTATFGIDQVALNVLTTKYVKDNDVSTMWSPTSTNPGEWLYIDLGVPTIVGGVRIYWGQNVPNSYRIQASLDATTWSDVYIGTIPPTANDWTEYSWPAVYARYLRVYFDDPGQTPPEIAEFQYYSRIVERVAAEHGHGSGVEKWKKGAKTRRGFKRKKQIKDKITKKKSKTKLSKRDIIELIEELFEYIDFKVPD